MCVPAIALIGCEGPHGRMGSSLWICSWFRRATYQETMPVNLMAVKVLRCTDIYLCSAGGWRILFLFVDTVDSKTGSQNYPQAISSVSSTTKICAKSNGGRWYEYQISSSRRSKLGASISFLGILAQKKVLYWGGGVSRVSICSKYAV